MTLQQWLFSIKGRIGRRDFWIWIAIWLVTMSALFTLAGSNLLNLQTAAFIIVCLLWPTAPEHPDLRGQPAHAPGA